MHTKKYLATTLLTSSLVMGLTFGAAHAQEKALQPQSSWALTKVDRAKQGGNSYCTLSRKYDDDVVLSVARNQTEEYSLAIDFQKPVFTKDKSVKVNLQPGPGQIRAYDLMPTSDKAIVIRLGWDTGFFDTLSQSQNLKAQVAGKDYSFSFSEIGKGQTDLQECMNSIIASSKGASPATAATDVLNAEPTIASNEFAAQKLGDAKPKVVMPAPVSPTLEVKKDSAAAEFAAAKVDVEKSPDAPIQTNFNKTKAAAESAEDPAPAAIEPAAKTASAAPVPAPISMPVSAIVPVPTPVVVSAPEAPKDNKEVKELRAKVASLAEENAAKEKAAAQAANLEKEVAAANAQKKALEEKLAVQQQAATQLAADKAKAEQAGQQAQANASKLKDLETRVADLTAQNAKLQQAGASVASMKQQNETLQAQLKSLQEESAGMTSKLTPIYQSPAEKSEAERLKQEVATLTTQNKSLQDQVAAQSKVAAAKQTTPTAEGLVKEIETLKAQNKSLQDQLAVQAKAASLAQTGATPVAPSGADAKALADAQAKIKELEIKNAQLNDTVRQSQTRIAETAINTEGAGLKKIAELEAKLEAAKADNATLSQQLDSTRLQQEDKRLNVVAGDWDLEKATKRFNEAEREIRRLGQKLEQERTSCNREKAQIENMLFDPAVTEQKQLEKLSSLEAQLQEAQDKLAGRISQTSMSADPSSVAPAAGADTSDLQATFASLRQENDALRDQNIVLKGNAEKANLQLTDIQSNGAVRADTVASARLQAEDVKRQLALKDSQNEALQNRVNMLQKENTQIKSRLSLTQEAAAAATNANYTNAGLAPLPTPRAPIVDDGDDKITSNISNQRERLNRSGDPAAAKLASMNPAAGESASVYNPAPKFKPSAAKSQYDVSSIQSLLQKSGLSTNGVKKSSVGMEGADNFVWSDAGNGNVRGLASVKSMGAPSEFEGTVNEYIANQKAMCPGDFASIPSDGITSASKKMALYEVACVSGDTSSSSSVVFFEDQGRFIAVANQTNAKDMDVAMDSRDRVANFVRGL